MMPMFWINYIVALALVALLLAGLTILARVASKRRLLRGSRGRIVSVLESTPITQNASIQIVKIGTQYFAVGISPKTIRLLTSISVPAPVSEPELLRSGGEEIADDFIAALAQD
jgi:flagellar biogenesis protein FliO